MNPLILGAIAIAAYLLFASRRRARVARTVRAADAMRAVMAAYRVGEYETALEETDGLSVLPAARASYCFMRGSMLHHLGRLDEAERSLREGLPLEDDPRKIALVSNVLAQVLMAQGRFPEAIAAYEDAERAWPQRGACHRGVAEVWLRQGEAARALGPARLAVAIDRHASDMRRDALDSRIGEDLGVLAWAVAASSGNPEEVESLVTEAFRLCDKDTKPVLAELHYHAGRAYAALGMPEKSGHHLRRGLENDPRGIFGKLAADALTASAASGDTPAAASR